MSKKNRLLVIVLILIAYAIIYIEMQKPARIASDAQDIVPEQQVGGGDRTAILAEKAKKYSRAKELADIAGYINAEQFALADMVGKKVILIDFWTYSCINCLRTSPYLNAWYDKYKDQGLVIVGVHTPEFAFEKEYANVEKAVGDEHIRYPVVLDNNYGTWSAYENRFWPRKYLIDIDGFIVYDHAGEGQYERTEQLIQQALKERMEVLNENGTIDSAMVNPNDAVKDVQTQSPETYFGAARNQSLGSGVANKEGEQYFAEPIEVMKNMLYLIGKWNITAEYAETDASVGEGSVGSDRIDYRYHAKSVYLVAGAKDQPVTLEVLRDSKPLDASFAGADVFWKDGRSYITVSGNRLYKIIEDTTPGEHLLEFIVTSPGLQVYTFTFG